MLTDALGKIITTAHDYRVPSSCMWINHRAEVAREPRMKLLVDGVQWTVFFKRGARGWLLKSAISGTEISTLSGVLDLIAAEGTRLDRAERAAQDEVAAQIAWEQSQVTA